MRFWRLPSAPEFPPFELPLVASAQQRGLCLMTIEFLTRFPAAECVVTCPSLPFWDTVFDLFPKTFFQVFLSSPEDPPRPNVLHHGARFDPQLAAKFGARGAPYNLIFTVEDMATQLNTYTQGSPAAAMLWIKEPVQDYLEGELVYPLYCSPYSGLCALIPSPGQARAVSYAGYYRAVLDFHAAHRHAGSAYDQAMEDWILRDYAQGISGVGQGVSGLVVEMTRNGLPRPDASEVVFWEPPAAVQLPVSAHELEALITAAFNAIQK